MRTHPPRTHWDSNNESPIAAPHDHWYAICRAENSRSSTPPSRPTRPPHAHGLIHSQYRSAMQRQREDALFRNRRIKPQTLHPQYLVEQARQIKPFSIAWALTSRFYGHAESIRPALKRPTMNSRLINAFSRGGVAL